MKIPSKKNLLMAAGGLLIVGALGIFGLDEYGDAELAKKINTVPTAYQPMIKKGLEKGINTLPLHERLGLKISSNNNESLNKLIEFSIESQNKVCSAGEFKQLSQTIGLSLLNTALDSNINLSDSERKFAKVLLYTSVTEECPQQKGM